MRILERRGAQFIAVNAVEPKRVGTNLSESEMGQERPNTNRSLGSRRFTETDGHEVPMADPTRPASHWTHTDWVTMPGAPRHDEVVCPPATRVATVRSVGMGTD